MAAHDGAPGVDGVRIKDLENVPGGVARFLGEPHDTLKRKRDRPQDALDAVNERLKAGLNAIARSVDGPTASTTNAAFLRSAP